MSDKKNIDRLFQEKFKDFDPTPDNQLWKQIEGKLAAEEKESKKVIPIWWRLGGIAATLALLFTLGYNYNRIFKADEITFPEQEIITDTKDTEIPSTLENLENNNTENPSTKEASKNNTRDILEQKQEIDDTFKVSTGVASKNTRDKNDKASQKDLKEKTVTEDRDSRIAVLDDEDKVPSKNDTSVIKTEEKIVETSESVVAEGNKKNEGTSKIKKDLIDESIESDPKVASSEEKKITIEEAIEEQKRLKESNVVAESEKRWSLNPSVAPVFFSSLSNGSPISSQLTDNIKSSNANLSYGVNIAYQVTKRLSIRSGISKVNYGYDTNNITVASNTNAISQSTPAFENVAFNNNAANVVINDAQNRNLSNEASSFSNALFFASAPEADAVLTQELGYIEIPLEVKYRLIDKRLGINVIGGMSTLFLTENSIFVQSENFTSQVGEANNLNNTNFSTNIGIGIDYNFSNKIQFNLEPVFKYQLNTFSSNSGNFKPYTLGFYTGFSFRF
ncbi:outer membrane beta-barrel protein [Flavobacteriaceae bacterium R38]|nr:outer membrane beta-barrel protein [Flavobacteriaceae bacterium R38]